VAGGAGKLGYVIDDNVIRISTVDDLNKSVSGKSDPASGASTPTTAPSADAVKLHDWVEDFFHHNYRDITDRKTLEWGEPQTTALGNLSIRYKFEAVIWDKDIMTMNKVFTFTPQGKYVSVNDVEGFPVKTGVVAPTSWPVIAEAKIDDALHAAVEKFFHGNYRDITARKTIEWGKPQKQPDGNWQIRYKYQATIWDKDQVLSNKIFTFSPTGEFVDVKDAGQAEPVRQLPTTVISPATKIADLVDPEKMVKADVVLRGTCTRNPAGPGKGGYPTYQLVITHAFKPADDAKYKTGSTVTLITILDVPKTEATYYLKPWPAYGPGYFRPVDEDYDHPGRSISHVAAVPATQPVTP
jgi:hypothetical protein